VPTDSHAAGQARPRLGVISLQHRFGSALNQYVHLHLHTCVTNGVFARSADGGGVPFPAARPLTASDLMNVTQRVRFLQFSQTTEYKTQSFSMKNFPTWLE
jgi:hypothetical protein